MSSRRLPVRDRSTPVVPLQDISQMPRGPGDDLAICYQKYSIAKFYCQEAHIFDAKRGYIAALRSRFLDFLKELYSVDKGMGKHHLSIPFEDVLYYDLGLAYGICLFGTANSLSEWVHPTVIDFLSGEGIEKDIYEIMEKGEPVTFSNMPNRITSVYSQLLQSDDVPMTCIKSIIDGTIKVCVASDFGLWLIRGFLEEIFNCHRKSQTWKGEFSSSDMVVINSSQFRIIKRPEKGYDGSDYSKDLAKIMDIFWPHFTSEGTPLFFDELQLYLGNDNEDVKDESFRGFILSHVALRPSVARLELVRNLHLVVGYCKANNLKIPRDLVAIPVTTRTQEWLQASKKGRNEKQDWRKLIPNDETDVLYKVYWYKRNPKDGRRPPYDSSTTEFLRYMRNVIEHGHEHVKGTVATEFEQYLAIKFHQYLPYILRKLWENHAIFFDGPLAPYLKHYCGPNILTDPDWGTVSFS